MVQMADGYQPTVARRYYFSADGLDKQSERLPCAKHYDVVLETQVGTEGKVISDSIHCRYVDYLASTAPPVGPWGATDHGPSAAAGLIDPSTKEADFEDIAGAICRVFCVATMLLLSRVPLR